jgi:hypothetical protein
VCSSDLEEAFSSQMSAFSERMPGAMVEDPNSRPVFKGKRVCVN